MNRFMKALRFIDRAYCDIAELADRLLVPVGNAVYNYYVRTWTQRFRRQVDDAIDRGISFFERQETLTFDAVATFLLMINKTFEPRLGRLDEKIRSYVVKWNDPHLRLLDEDYDPESGASAVKQAPDPDALFDVEKPLLTCLYADRSGIREKALEEVEALGDDGAYGTTHRVLSYVVLKRFGEIPEAVLDERIEFGISRIVEAQRSASASDILYERTVLLQWLGRDHLVQPAWIVRILRAQRESGGWRWTRSFRQRREEQHPSCLGLSALIHFRRKQLDSAEGPAPIPSVIGRVMKV